MMRRGEVDICEFLEELKRDPKGTLDAMRKRLDDIPRPTVDISPVESDLIEMTREALDAISEKVVKFDQQLINRALAVAALRGSEWVEERDAKYAAWQIAKEMVAEQDYGRSGLPVSVSHEACLREWISEDHAFAAGYLKAVMEDLDKPKGKTVALRSVMNVLIGILESGNELLPSEED